MSGMTLKTRFFTCTKVILDCFSETLLVPCFNFDRGQCKPRCDLVFDVACYFVPVPV